MIQKTTLEMLASAGVRYQALGEALNDYDPDHTNGKPSLHSLSDRANERLRAALQDYILTAHELVYWMKKTEAG